MSPRRLCCLFVIASLGGCAASSGSVSRAGSMSRFALTGSHLYTLAGRKLVVYDINQPATPKRVSDVSVPQGAETLFMQRDLLYLGSQTGMFVYALRNPAAPRYLGGYRHVVSCDPVVVRGGIAFVTLRAGTRCRRGLNALQIFDVRNPTKPKLLYSYKMERPTGLGIDGSLLFVTDGRRGLRIYDATNPLNLRLIHQRLEIDGYDVIPNGGVLIISAKDGLYQLDYRQRRFTLLSKITIYP